MTWVIWSITTEEKDKEDEILDIRSGHFLGNRLMGIAYSYVAMLGQNDTTVQYVSIPMIFQGRNSVWIKMDIIAKLVRMIRL